jgi:anion-transporting  ArsA/GET3 family ATPase
VLRFKVVHRAVMENSLVKYFLRAVPALNEYSMLGKAWWHTTEIVDGQPKYETVIFDGPAMGHLISMLRIPQVICDTVPGGPLVADARRVRDLLQDPARTCMCIVTLAEEMPVREALELYQAARDDLHILPARIFVNALYPEEFERPDLGDELAALRAGSPTLAPLLAAAETLRARRLINRRYLDLLEQRLPLPRVELPHLFGPQLDRAALDVLGARIEAALPT